MMSLGRVVSKRRTALTLLEILIAILIMGVGLLAIASLFPVGLLATEKAIQDTRASIVGISALDTVMGRDLLSDEEVFKALDGSGTSIGPLVVIDPLGRIRAPSGEEGKIDSVSSITKRPELKVISDLADDRHKLAASERLQVAGDDVSFDDTGNIIYTLNSSGDIVGRGYRGRYSWLATAHRRVADDPASIELAVAVFESRTFVDNDFSEFSVEGDFSSGSDQIKITGLSDDNDKNVKLPLLEDSKYIYVLRNSSSNDSVWYRLLDVNSVENSGNLDLTLTVQPAVEEAGSSNKFRFVFSPNIIGVYTRLVNP